MSEKTIKGEAEERKDWDGTIKAWVNECPQQFVTWLRKGAIFQRSLATELKQITDFDGDNVLEIKEQGKDALMEIEFQSTYRSNVGGRLLLYNDLVSAQHGYKPVWSYLIYLSNQGQPANHEPSRSNGSKSVYIKTMPDGTEIKRLYYTCINMWEVTASELRALGLDGLLPLIPLTRDGVDPKVIEQLAEELKAKKQYKSIPVAKAFTQYRLGDTVDPDWIERIYDVAKDILGDTPTARYWRREGAEEERKRLEAEMETERKRLEAERKRLEAEQQRLEAKALQVNGSALLGLVQARFPDLVPFASKVVKDVKDPNILPDALVKIGLAQDKQAIIDALIELASK